MTRPLVVTTLGAVHCALGDDHAEPDDGLGAPCADHCTVMDALGASGEEDCVTVDALSPAGHDVCPRGVDRLVVAAGGEPPQLLTAIGPYDPPPEACGIAVPRGSTVGATMSDGSTTMSCVLRSARVALGVTPAAFFAAEGAPPPPHC